MIFRPVSQPCHPYSDSKKTGKWKGSAYCKPSFLVMKTLSSALKFLVVQQEFACVVCVYVCVSEHACVCVYVCVCVWWRVCGDCE